MKVDTDEQDSIEHCSGAMSTATSQTPFILPTLSDSCLTSPNDEVKPNGHKLQAAKNSILEKTQGPIDGKLLLLPGL